MRFGNCTTNPAEFSLLKQYGYSFAESNFQVVKEMTEKDFTDLSQAVETFGIPVEGMNCFAHPEMKILTWSDEKAAEYFESGVRRAKILGLKYLVIGSGGARKVPDGITREAAVRRLVELLKMFGQIAERYDIDVYLEPLRQFETDMINTVTEAVEICKQVNHPHVGCVADFYHMASESEPFSDVAKSEGYLRHIHVATANRTIPLRTDAEETLKIATELKAIQYNGRIVLEGSAEPDMETALKEFSEQFTVFGGGDQL